MSGRKHYYGINQVLYTFMEQNSKMELPNFEMFLKVYYPIAILEIDMDEITFEDFDFVSLTVLKLVKEGARSASDVAKLTGLSRSYSQKMLDLLMGYGYVSNSGITDLGKESLDNNKKIARTQVKQRFQADAITGDLLHLNEQFSEADLEDVDEIKKDKNKNKTPVVPHIMGISEEYVNKQLNMANLRDYMRYQGDILNANVDKIKNVRCVDLVYTDAYMIKLQDVSLPIIVTNHYIPSPKNSHAHFRWGPTRLPDIKSCARYGFDKKILNYDKESGERISEFYDLVLHHACDEINEENIKDCLEKLYSFNFSYVKIDMGQLGKGRPGQIRVFVEAKSFTCWRYSGHDFVLNLLEKYNFNYGYLFADYRFNGLLLLFETNDQEIKNSANILQSALSNFPRNELLSFLKTDLTDQDKKGNKVDFSLLKEEVDGFAQNYSIEEDEFN